MHLYDYIKSDYENWSKFVDEDGIILMHDVYSFHADVVRYFNEIKEPKGMFTHSYGLGVITKNKNILLDIKNNFNNFIII